jgi:hypothetical protein
VQEQGGGSTGNNALHFTDEKSVDRGLSGLLAGGYEPSVPSAPSTASPSSAGGALINGTTSLEYFDSVNQTYDFPANSLQAGKVVRVRAWGNYGTKSSSPGTLTLGLMLTQGGSSAYLCQSPAITVTANLSATQWRSEADILITTSGDDATVEAQGMALLSTSSSSGTLSCWPLQNTIGLGPIDLTIATTLLLTAQWSVADVSNNITLRLVTFEMLN